MTSPPAEIRGRRFTKMHGLGNDFVVIDARTSPLRLDPAAARLVADRRRGVGCDQLILLEPPRDAAADVFMRILNPDASEAGACGNGTRCVADLLMRESGGERVIIETIAGLLDAARVAETRVSVDMGAARLDWRDVPLARPCDTAHVDVAVEALTDPACCSMGNPHATFFVADAEAIDLPRLGPRLEHHPMFPDRANIGIVQVLDRGRLRFRVWERGAGITEACGSGACAAVVNAARRDLCERHAVVVLDGGELEIAWRPDGHVVMTGPVATSFTGELAL
jgi:diaminopimelate epimerase